MAKRLPLFLSALFIGVTVTRVSRFAGGDVLGWLFSVGLAGGVFLSAYYVDYGQAGAQRRPTHRPALFALVFFVVVDGLFNLAEVLNHSLASGRWATAVVLVDGFYWHPYRIADVVFGIFPTLAVALMGWLARGIEKIGGRPKGWKKAFEGFITGWLLGHTEPQVIDVVPDRIIGPVSREEWDDHKNGKKSARSTDPRGDIYALLDGLDEDADIPSVRAIAEQVGCAVSTASAGRRAWQEERTDGR